MPIYEYECGSCQHELEALQKMSEAPLVDCPACAEPALVRKISAAGFRLKGSGWYETDFKSSNRKNLPDGGGDSNNSESTAGTSNDRTAAGSAATDARRP